MIKGQCLCGAIQFQYHGEIEASILCYCQHCQQAQGSFAAWNSPVDQNQFELISGQELLKAYFHTPNKARVFCQQCGSPIYSYRTDLPNIVRLRLGTITEERFPRQHKNFLLNINQILLN